MALKADAPHVEFVRRLLDTLEAGSLEARFADGRLTTVEHHGTEDRELLGGVYREVPGGLEVRIETSRGQPVPASADRWDKVRFVDGLLVWDEIPDFPLKAAFRRVGR